MPCRIELSEPRVIETRVTLLLNNLTNMMHLVTLLLFFLNYCFFRTFFLTLSWSLHTFNAKKGKLGQTLRHWSDDVIFHLGFQSCLWALCVRAKCLQPTWEHLSAWQARLSASGRPTHSSGNSRSAGPIRVPSVVDTVFKDDTSQCFSQMKFIFFVLCMMTF